MTWAAAWEETPQITDLGASRALGAVALQPLPLLSVQCRAPGAEAGGPHKPDSRELMLFSPDVHCGNAVTCKEAGETSPRSH